MEPQDWACVHAGAPNDPETSRQGECRIWWGSQCLTFSGFSLVEPFRQEYQGFPTPSHSQRRSVMVKKGDMFTNIKSGEVYTVTSIRSDMVILSTKGNFHSIITSLGTMDATFTPFEEAEKPVKPK
jgi:hypothetical protein